MQIILRLLPALAFFAFLLFTPTETRADALVITGGTVTIGGTPNTRSEWRALSYNFFGANVSVHGGTGDGDNTHRPDTICAPCAPGMMVSPNSTIFSEGIGTAVINGSTVGAWFNARDTIMTFTGPSVLFPGDTNNASTITLSTSFTMTGTLVVRDINGSGFPVVFTSPIVGQGTAFLTFTLLPQGYFLSNITYQFSDAAQAPEPATLLLLGTGLAGAALYKRRRRRTAD
jgi:hypothetical protein